MSVMRLHDRLAVHDIVGVLTGSLPFSFLNLVSELVTSGLQVSNPTWGGSG